MSDDLQIREPQWVAPDVPIPIQSHDDYLAVADSLREVKEFQSRVKHFFADMKDRAHKAWKAIVAKEKETLEIPLGWEAECKKAMVVWDDEQERLRQEEQRRLEAEARKQEEERRLAEAEALEAEAQASGDEALAAEAERIIEEPIETPVVQVAKSTPKVSGVSYREKWSAQVTNLHDLVKYVAQRPEMIGLLQANGPALNAQARSLKGQMRIPGVKAVSERVVASSGR